MESPSWFTLIAAVTGGILSLAGAFGIEAWREWRQTRNLRSAFAGELRAVLLSVDDTDLIAVLERTVQQIQLQQTPVFSNLRVAGEMHNAVFRANADKLGRLPAPLPERLALVHYHAGGIIGDLNNLADIAEGRPGFVAAQVRTDWQRCLRYHQNVLERSRRTRQLMADVVNELEGLAS